MPTSATFKYRGPDKLCPFPFSRLSVTGPEYGGNEPILLNSTDGDDGLAEACRLFWTISHFTWTITVVATRVVPPTPGDAGGTYTVDASGVYTSNIISSQASRAAPLVSTATAVSPYGAPISFLGFGVQDSIGPYTAPQGGVVLRYYYGRWCLDYYFERRASSVRIVSVDSYTNYGGNRYTVDFAGYTLHLHVYDMSYSISTTFTGGSSMDVHFLS